MRAAWFQLTAVQLIGRWHISHWLPSLVSYGSSRRRIQWQSKHFVGVPFVTPFRWQLAHATVRWRPSSGNSVTLWNAREADLQAVGVWQVEQAVPSAPLWASWWHGTHAGLLVRNDRVLWQRAHVFARA